MAEAKKTVADILLASALDEDTMSIFRAQRNSRQQQQVAVLPEIELCADDKLPPHRNAKPRQKSNDILFRESKSVHRELNFWSIVEEFAQLSGESSAPTQERLNESHTANPPAEFELI